MNERIRQLAEQAGHTPLEPRTFADDLNEIFLQKFAELIVQECIRLCDQVDVVGADECIDNIKEHFGGEE